MAATTHFSSDMNKLVPYALVSRVPCTLFVPRNPRPAARHPVAALQAGNSTVSQTAIRDLTGQGTIGKSELHSTPRIGQTIRTKTRTSAGDRFPNTLEEVFVHQQNPLGSGCDGKEKNHLPRGTKSRTSSPYTIINLVVIIIIIIIIIIINQFHG